MRQDRKAEKVRENVKGKNYGKWDQAEKWNDLQPWIFGSRTSLSEPFTVMLMTIYHFRLVDNRKRFLIFDEFIENNDQTKLPTESHLDWFDR